MDRELSVEHIRGEKNKSLVKYISIAVVIVFAFMAFYSFLKPSISRNKIRVATTELAPIEASLTASGIVQPEYEQIINSPIQSKIELLYLKAGETVEHQQAILKLNTDDALSNYNKLKDEYDLRVNKKLQLQLSLESDLIDLRSSYSIKKLRIKSLEKKVSQEERLYKLGAGSKETLDQAQLTLEINRLELKQLDEKIKNQAASLKADLRELDLSLQIQGKIMNEQQRRLDLAEARSDLKGVVTFVNDQIGANVNPGDVIARIADLSSFKIEGSVSDIYAGKLKIGGSVSVRINDITLSGSINQINPAVANGVINFNVKLNKNNHQALRSNLRVQVFVITDFKDNIIRVKNGPFYNGSKDQRVFVIEGNKVIRKFTNIGVSNFDHVELLTGIKAGEQIIISDMRDYLHLTEIDLED